MAISQEDRRPHFNSQRPREGQQCGTRHGISAINLQYLADEPLAAFQNGLFSSNIKDGSDALGRAVQAQARICKSEKSADGK